MPRIYGALLFLILLCAPARAESPDQIPNPRVTRRSWVSDNANVVSDATERRINDLLTRLERKTGAEIAVVTVRSLDGMAIEDFAIDLARRWKIGKPGDGEGALLLAAIGDRKVRIEVNSNLEARLTDAQAKAITREIIRPAFQAKKYDQGLYDATYAIARRVDPSLPATIKAPSGEAPPSRAPSGSAFEVPDAPQTDAPALAPSFETPPTSANPAPGVMSNWLVGIIALGVGALALTVWRSTRPRKCPRCGTRMELVPEAQEDAFLTDVQQFEESIGGRDWKVWRCPRDGHVELQAQDRWNSGISDCRVCSNHTVTSNTQTLLFANEFQEGLEETTHVCQWPQCRHRWTTQRTIPRVMPVVIVSSGGSSASGGGGFDSGSSGGSSSGGYDSGPSDFGGGGDFSGGGASDSW